MNGEISETWYGQAADQVAAMSREAEALMAGGKAEQAATVISAGQPLVNRLLSVPKPTLPAMESVSDLDRLYGRMLMGNQHYGWARLLFQKNQTRWRVWKPQTPDTVRRLKQAEGDLAECDRLMAK